MQPEEIRRQLAALHRSAFGWAMVCCRRDRDLAADVLQQAYCRILEGKAKFRGEGRFSTWAFGVIRHVAWEEIRRRQRGGLRETSTPIEELSDASSTGEANLLQQVELSEQLWNAMRQLSDRQRQVLHLIYYEEMTVRQAAEVMEISFGAASQHFQRGKDALRRILAAELEVD